MKKVITYLRIMVFLPFIFICSNQIINAQGGNGNGGNGGGGGGNGGGGEPPTETAGNNLSFPVIFADGGSKVLPGTMGEYSIEGEWWYVWGEDPIDPQAPLYSCKPNSDNLNLCDDGSSPGDGISTIYKAYVQKDAKNVWQANNTSVPAGETLNIDWVDWGDNLESIDWTIRSQVRTEVVLYEDIDSVTQFNMRHVDSWGSDEVHGLQTTLQDEVVYGSGTQATVFSPNARFTIQKLNIETLDEVTDKLFWEPEIGWTEIEPTDNLVNEAIFNMAVSEAGDGPGYYNAEINVKGKIIFGYTWNLKEMNDGTGYYRLTFSFDEGDEALGTAKFDEFTQILLPLEDEEAIELVEITGEEGRGGSAIMDPANNLTYMDVYIKERGSGNNKPAEITGLELIDAVNDVSLGSLTNGMKINIDDLPVSNLTIEALATEDVGSVKFQLSGDKSVSRIENTPPYSLFGHTNGNYSGENFTTGNYSLTVTPYSEDSENGEVGTALTVSFEIISAPPDDTAGNNLSFPVIFADGGSKVLPGIMGEYTLEGEWWYVWGEDPIDPQAPINSCKPSETNSNHCADTNLPPGDGISTVYKAYIQKDKDNLWQAYNESVTPGDTLNVDWIDWGDNLESIAWQLNSKVRTEIVLLKDIDSVTEFKMRHVDSWGIDEVHGLQTTRQDEVVYGPGTQATVFSPNARLTIQKLNYRSGGFSPARLMWVAKEGWTEVDPEEVDVINEPIFNLAVSDAGTGPDYFNAEINVKGKIIYGYTWDVGDLNEGDGHYRLTFSFDEGDGITGTAGFSSSTQIIVPVEEEAIVAADEGGPGEGGTPILDATNNITYIDVLVGDIGPILSSYSIDYESFKIYPNPVTNGIVNIKSSTANSVDVYDVLGHLVFKSKLNASQDVQTLDLSLLQSGLYFVKLTDGTYTSVKKIILK